MKTGMERPLGGYTDDHDFRPMPENGGACAVCGLGLPMKSWPGHARVRVWGFERVVPGECRLPTAASEGTGRGE